MRKEKIVSALLLFAWANVLAGGGWTQKKGEGYFKLGTTYLSTDQFYSRSGEAENITTTSLSINYIYGEYGINDDFTITTYAPFFIRTTLNEIVSKNTGSLIEPGDELNGVGDFDIGLKYGLLKNTKVVMAPSVTLSLPLGTVGGGNTELLQTGDGEMNVLTKLEASTAIKKYYFTAIGGINVRSEQFSEEWHLGFEAGYASEKLIAASKLYSVQSFFNGSDNAGNGSSIFSNNLEYITIGGELTYLFGSLGISAGVSYPLSGRSFLNAPAYSGGIVYLMD